MAIGYSEQATHCTAFSPGPFQVLETQGTSCQAPPQMLSHNPQLSPGFRTLPPTHTCRAAPREPQTRFQGCVCVGGVPMFSLDLIILSLTSPSLLATF